MSDLFNYKGADISECGKYRYTLWRIWDNDKPYAVFIGLNPSTADALNDDPTIRRCIGFAKKWGYGGIYMINLFAYRATEPKVMLSCIEPVGPDNDNWIEKISSNAGIIIAAWGTHGNHLSRDKEIINKINNLHCLDITKNGHPKHPLYIKSRTMPRTFNA